MNAGGSIVEAGLERASILADLHGEALSNDFFPSLGRRFLREIYYGAALRSAHAATLVAEREGRTLGFATVAWDSAALSAEILRGRKLRFGAFVLAAAARRPVVLLQALDIGISILTSPWDPLPAEIVFIAVASEARGQGIGTLLIRACVDRLAARGVSRCRTKTLASNAQVIRLYRRLGWNVRDRFRLIGRNYVTLVSPEEAGGAGP